MTNKIVNSQIKIIEPILESDFKEALKLIEDNLVVLLTLDELKKLPVGRLYLAKIEDKIAGVMQINYPGEELHNYKEKCIILDKIKVKRQELASIPVIVVSSEYQKMGIGKRLIKKGLKELENAGAKAVLTHIWMSSPGNASEKLFTSFGFLPIKIHKKIWFENSKKMGPKKYSCAVCGNPCTCDALEMIKYLK